MNEAVDDILEHFSMYTSNVQKFANIIYCMLFILYFPFFKIVKKAIFAGGGGSEREKESS